MVKTLLRTLDMLHSQSNDASAGSDGIRVGSMQPCLNTTILNKTAIGELTLPDGVKSIRATGGGFIEYYNWNSGTHTCPQLPKTAATFGSPRCQDREQRYHRSGSGLQVWWLRRACRPLEERNFGGRGNQCWFHIAYT